ncbi:hypothetical protein BDZ91DRAFT_712455, partial [Kalaharituber pfeilii]
MILMMTLDSFSLYIIRFSIYRGLLVPFYATRDSNSTFTIDSTSFLKTNNNTSTVSCHPQWI